MPDKPDDHSTGHGTATAVRHESTLPPWRFWLLSLGISVGLFLAMMDTSIVSTSLLTIGEDLGNMDKVNWVALSYTLAYLGCAVFFARSADVIGRRNAYLVAFSIFFAFSLGCGFAQNIQQLVVCRALQGIGGSGLYSLSMIIWPEVAPNHLLKHIASLAGIVIAAAGVLGPVLGGILTHYASWRWIFWINGPVIAIFMPVFALSWPRAEYLPSTPRRSWKTLDFLGSFLLIAAAVLVTFSFQNASSGGSQWGKAIFLAPLLTGLLCWVLLFVWEWIVEKRMSNMLSAFPLKLVRNRVYTSALLHTMLVGFSFFGVVYNFPTRLQVVNGKSALTAGVMLLPMLGGVAFGSFLSGAIITRSNRIFELMAIASALMTLGCGLETTLSDSVKLEAKALGFLPFIGLGLGLASASSTMLAVAEAPEGEHAPSQGILAQIRVLGGSIGIAASSAILAAQETAKFGTVLSTEALKSPQTTAEAELVRAAYADAFTEDMRVCTIISAVSILAAFGIYRRNRDPFFHVRSETENVHSSDEETRASPCEPFPRLSPSSEFDAEHKESR